MRSALRWDIPSEFIGDVALHFRSLEPHEPIEKVWKRQGTCPAAEHVGLGLDERFIQHEIQQMRCIEMRAQEILEHGIVARRIIAFNGMLPDYQPLAHITPQARLRITRPVVAQRKPQVIALGLERVRHLKPLPPPLHPNLGNALLYGPAHLIE